MGGAVAALTIRNDLAVGCHARVRIHLLQLVGRLELALRGQISGPFDVDGVWNRAAALGANGGAAVLAVAPGIDDHRIRPRDRISNLAPRRQCMRFAPARPLACRRWSGVARDWQPGPRPRPKPAIEHAGRRVAEVLEKPESSRGANARLLVVRDDRRRGVDAMDCEHMLDHPHERVERRRIRVGQAQTPQIDMNRPGDVTGDVGIRRAQVEDQRSGVLRPLELDGQLARSNQQLRVDVPFHSRNRTTGASLTIHRRWRQAKPFTAECAEPAENSGMASFPAPARCG